MTRRAARRLLVGGFMKSLLFVTVLLAPTVGCIGDDKGPEEELEGIEDGGKADTQRMPTDHGAMIWNVNENAIIDATTRFHAWEFTLSGDAKIDVRTTYTVRGQRRTDTVMYLYRQQPGGNWGSYISRNDDYNDTTYSRIAKGLTAGTYRILVKGHDTATNGKFSTVPTCIGDGCAPPPDPNACLFGDTYHDMLESPALQIGNQYKITAANLGTVSAENQRRMVVAVQQSSHTDVMTPAEALDAVDQNEINFTSVWDPEGQRAFIAFEYGVGDNSYGGIFDDATGAIVQPIHDGDLYDCTIKAETCLLPDDWGALRSDPAFEKTTSRVVTAASQLSTTEQAQALAALQQTYPGQDLATALHSAQDHEINVASFTHKATGTKLDVFEYAAGDTSLGAVFYAGTTNRAATINDLTFYGCTLFAH